MAENIRLAHLILYDKWPGTPNPNLGIPRGGFDATEWNLSTMDDTDKADNPPYPLGTKIQVYTDNSECPGNYTMMYLARHEFSSECISSDISESNIFCSLPGTLCQTHTAAVGVDSSGPCPYYFVSQCYTTASCEVSMGNPIAIPCTTVDGDSSESLDITTNDPRAQGFGHSLGWFWVGGVCPAGDITFYRGLGDTANGPDITCDGAAMQRKGSVMLCYTAASVEVFGCDLTNYNDTTDLKNGVTPSDAAFAWACASSAG